MGIAKRAHSKYKMGYACRGPFGADLLAGVVVSKDGEIFLKVVPPREERPVRVPAPPRERRRRTPGKLRPRAVTGVT